MPGEKGAITIFHRDEHPRPDTTMKQLSELKTVYGSPTVTAGNASGICDGATATLIMSGDEAEARGVRPLARIVDYLPMCGEPRQTPVLPGVAIEAILSKNGLTLNDVQLIEINEAFASMPLVSTLYLAGRERSKAEKIRVRVNVNGGAIAIGHPIGATGARILMTMVYELRRRGGRYGVAAIFCASLLNSHC
ncbi:MAG: hypothetical protein M1543_00435 [Firmicutes bacterium]|nr:hypothetical protein [Bacillota bacterium]